MNDRPATVAELNRVIEGVRKGLVVTWVVMFLGWLAICFTADKTEKRLDRLESGKTIRSSADGTTSYVFMEAKE
jgi:hypothetical protein